MKHQPKTTQGSAKVFAFPSARHRKIVNFIATQMRKQPSQDAAEQYLVSHLEIEWSRLEGLGIDPVEIEQSCRDFADAAWTLVFRGAEHEGAA